MKKVLLILIICCGYISTTFAQEEIKEVMASKTDVIRRVELATSLANYGYSTYSATALLEAARILNEIAIQPLKYESYEQEGAANNQVKEENRAISVVQLLTDAREYADGDKTILSMINKFKPRDNHRGRVDGVGVINTSISSLTTDVYTIQFEVDDSAEVLLSGNGAADLDLYVYDADGGLIGKSIDATDNCYVSWHSKSQKAHTVKIKNIGSSNNSYTMITN